MTKAAHNSDVYPRPYMFRMGGLMKCASVCKGMERVFSNNNVDGWYWYMLYVL
jgi:hypothetical protein